MLVAQVVLILYAYGQGESRKSTAISLQRKHSISNFLYVQVHTFTTTSLVGTEYLIRDRRVEAIQNKEGAHSVIWLTDATI